MLTDLVVEGLGVIERAELRLGPGCTALTGETGAGKTLLVAALELLAGGRGDRALVRGGAGEARLEARFVVAGGHPAAGALRKHGVIEDGTRDGEVEIVLARSLSPDGRGGRARINGHLVTNTMLAESGATLVEIAGQHSAQGIGSSSRQRALLDAYAGQSALADETAAAVRDAAAAARTYEGLQTSRRTRERELDVLRYEIGEIERAELVPGECERLEAEAERLEHAESIARALTTAIDALKGEGGADELVATAEKAVDEAAARDPAAGALAERLRGASVELADIAGELSARMVTPDPGALADLRDRLAAIARLTRKYGNDEAEVLDYLERARARVAELESTEDEAGELGARRASLDARAQELAERLARARAEAAPRLERAMVEVLAELALGGSTFVVELTPRPLYEGGLEAVEFGVSTNAGETPSPLSKVASGGELSRIALALHLLTRASADPTTSGRTMVFDEVDAGVGGRSAQAVGRALARLGRPDRAQVVVITHHPQVAAFADSHYRVTKGQDGGRTSAAVARVESDERIDELSRMLAGMPESARAREHARELLDVAAEMVAT